MMHFDQPTKKLNIFRFADAQLFGGRLYIGRSERATSPATIKACSPLLPTLPATGINVLQGQARVSASLRPASRIARTSRSSKAILAGTIPAASISVPHRAGHVADWSRATLSMKAARRSVPTQPGAISNFSDFCSEYQP